MQKDPDCLVAPFEVTNSPEWPPTSENLNSGKKYFYIDADISCGWPYQSKSTLCKFGVTDKKPERRRREHERVLQEEWGIEADLELVFVATGQITSVEKMIADYTLPWLPDRFQENSEWRRCPPRELARIAILVAEEQRR